MYPQQLRAQSGGYTQHITLGLQRDALLLSHGPFPKQYELEFILKLGDYDLWGGLSWKTLATSGTPTIKFCTKT